MRFLSLFSGIEAASVAFIPMGWTCVAVAEIEKFPCAVLAHHYPDVPNLGNVKEITEDKIKALGHIDAIIFGFPCQDLSVAGKRKGLKNEDGSNTRSGLFYIAMQIVRWSGARWAVAENVPGLLSSNAGLDFASVVGEMCGGEISMPKNKWQNSGVALGRDGLVEWAVLDAQFFGVAQRRRRVFIVRDIGNWSSRSPVLFEPESLRGDNPPSREARKEITGTLSARTQSGGGLGTDFDIAGGLQASTAGADENDAKDGRLLAIPIQEPGKRTGRSTNDRGVGIGIGESGDSMYTLQAGAVHGVAHSLRAEGFDASEDGTGRGTPLIPIEKWPASVAPTLNAHFGSKQGLEDQHALGGAGLFVPAIAFSCKDHAADAGEISPTLRSMGHAKSHPNAGGQVAVAFHPTQDPISSTDGTTHALGCGSSTGQASVAVAFQESQSGCREYETSGCLRANGPGYDPVGTRVHAELSVRRLTPKECERLQGFPDNYTNIPWGKKSESPDGPRYKALGNSMAVPCMRWIGMRIAKVDASMLMVQEEIA
jgi:DNA (cytosine-5)-methyltransferase 1